MSVPDGVLRGAARWSALSQRWAAELASDGVAATSDRKLSDEVAARLQSLIERDLRIPGGRLPPERELADVFGVSRSSMREAMNQLVVKGLVDRRPGRGTVVIDRSNAHSQALRAATALSPEIIDAFDFRAVVEPPIAGMAAMRATAADLIRMEDACNRMDLERNARRFAELDQLFHSRIAQACHNRLLSTLIDLTSEWIATTRITTLQTSERRALSRRAHRRIYEAIAKGNPTAAEAAMGQHIAEVARLLQERD